MLALCSVYYINSGEELLFCNWCMMVICQILFGQYLGYIWTRFEKQKKNVEKTTKVGKSWTRELTVPKYSKYPEIYSADLPNWPKSLGYR